MTALGTWEAAATTVGSTLAALDDLRRTSELGSTRSLVMTLVIVGTEPDGLDRALAGVHELGSKHPARTLVIRLRPTADAGLDAAIDLEGSGDDNGRHVVFEDIHLDVAGPATRHLDSFIEPFTLPDLPVVVWFVDALPSPADPVLSSADVVVVDSRDFGGLDCFTTVAVVSRMRPLIDLSWVRLQPWRAALRGLFDTPVLRPFANAVATATVTGKTGPRHLMAAWLADRLDLSLGDLHLQEAEHVTLELHAQHASRRETVAVRREHGHRTLTAEGRVEGGPTFEASLPLPPAGPAWGLAEGLSSLARDRVFEAALATALDF